MSEIVDKIKDQMQDSQSSLLNTCIAFCVAISATFVTIYNIKDNNVVQAMSQAQAHAIDAWSYYQAKSIKGHLAESAKQQVEMQLITHDNLSLKAKEKLQALADTYQQQSVKFEGEKVKIKSDAEGFQKEYDSLNIFDDQFDMAEAMISLALAIFGISAMTRKWTLFGFGVSMSLLGIIFGIAAFAGWNLHPAWLARLLG